MILSDLAVRRPVAAVVANLLLLVFGLAAMSGIPVREYPDIDPPVVSINTSYPGASAEIVESKVTQVLEDQIAGIEGIRSLSSTSRDGRSNITIEFRLTRDIDAAANDVRDRVSRVLNNLPDEADPPEVSKADVDASPILWMVLSSDSRNALQLTDYAERFLVDRFGALDGVSAVRIGGDRRPAMRIWLDARALAARNLAVEDVEQALRAQNVERPAGLLESVDREYTLRTSRAYASPEQFAQLVVALGSDGYPIRLGDIARVEVGPEEPRTLFRANGRPAVGLGVVKQSTANTLSVARAAKAEMERIAATLPPDMALRVNSDFSLFIEASLNEVVITLLIAAALVVLVIFLFLRDWRATLIPAATVPVSLIASFIFLDLFGFSINILTLLALVLAIGLVVDDTIVVVENIHRRLTGGEPPLLAAFNGTREVGFAVVATTAVLVAVFTPLAFLEGNVGRLFSEFALALAAAVVCSALVALTLTPVLCSVLLRPNAGAGHSAADRLANGYAARLGPVVDKPWLAVAGMVLLAGGAVLLFQLLPREFTPREDRGQFIVQATAPEGASFAYTARYMDQVEAILLKRLGNGEIDRMLIRLPGFGGGSGVNTGNAMVSLTDWRTRERPTDTIAGEISSELAALPGVRALAVQRSGFGSGYGQPVQVVLGGNDYAELVQWRDRLMARIAAENPRITRLDSDFRETKPALTLDIDLARAARLGVSAETVARTLETLLAGRAVTTWQEGGEEYDVLLQAAPDDRAEPADLAGIHVRAQSGALVPLANLLATRESASAASYPRQDRLRSITITGGLAEGYTLGEALAFIERVAAEELPPTARLSYKGDSRELKDSGSALLATFALALLVVFLVLAAQFESFVHPLVIMTTVPLAVFGALLALLAGGYSLNIYTQIGMVMLIGLVAKNGILIVEFANQRRAAGLALRAALLDASRTRLRPILMTSIATVAGAVPLLVSGGAGAEARANLGVVVFWGVIFATALTLFVVPAFYALLAHRAGEPGARAQALARQQEEDKRPPPA
jgi:multidrug efflux pump